MTAALGERLCLLSVFGSCTTDGSSKRICGNRCGLFLCFFSHRQYLGRGVDPDGRVEQNVVTQLLEEHDAILQIAQVSGKGQHDVQDGPRHVHLGGLQCRQAGEDGRMRLAGRSTDCV